MKRCKKGAGGEVEGLWGTDRGRVEGETSKCGATTC